MDLDDEDMLALYKEARAQIDRRYPRGMRQQLWVAGQILNDASWLFRWVDAHGVLESLEQEDVE